MLGFADTRPEVTESDYSCDVATNRYADLWYNRFEGRQVFDYVMTRSGGGVAFDLVRRQRALDGEDPLSDHFGLQVVLELRRENPGEE